VYWGRTLAGTLEVEFLLDLSSGIRSNDLDKDICNIVCHY
jgi:hypothetical protein